MTHQSGIHANDYVKAQFSNAHVSNTRALKVGIDDEALVILGKSLVNKSWDEDYDAAVIPMLEKTVPCYIFYKLDTSSQFGNDWALINWVPDEASVRDKMIYASTRATVKKQFGDHLIKEDVNGNTIDDLTLNGFKRYIAMKSAPAPLTMAEQEKADVLKDEVSGGFFSAPQTLSSVAFDLTSKAYSAVQDFTNEQLDYVQLMIHLEGEKIDCSFSAQRLHPQYMATHIPENEGRYHLYRFRHSHNGSNQVSILFIHSISGYQSSVKSRMLYSSCKSALLARLEQQFGLQFAHRLETDNMSELNEAYLLDLLYPKPPEQKLFFEKPAGPAGRRPRTQRL